MFIDSHAHLFDRKFDSDIERVLERARAAGVERIITLGDNIENSKRAIGLALRYPEILAAVGIHPHHAREWAADKDGTLRRLSEIPRVVAIGEIGLDYHYNPDSRALQREVLREQLALAREVELPVSIHCREAYEDLLEDIHAQNGNSPGGVIHCFSGGYEDARALTDLGFFLGVGGTITFPNAGPLRDVLKAIGIDFLILETDSPYLAPQAKRGRRNEPAHLPLIARALAELTGHAYRDVARTTRYNTLRAFRLSRDADPQTVFIWEGKIYINLTNECTNVCDFCHRHGDGIVRGVRLRLAAPPTEDAIYDAVAGENYDCYSEVIFSGLGEPTMRIDALMSIARRLKARGKRIVLETNGQGALHHHRPILKELEGIVDEIRVSLNAPDRETYNEMCHPEDPDHAFDAIVEFLREARAHFPVVKAMAVDLPELDLAAIRRLAEEEIGVPLLVRPFERVM